MCNNNNKSDDEMDIRLLKRSGNTKALVRWYNKCGTMYILLGKWKRYNIV